MSGSQQTILKSKGLYTFSNPLSSAVPEGSFAEVSNVVVDRNEIIEPRRGFFQYQNPFGDGTDRAKQLFNYKDVIIRHVLNQLDYDLNGEFSEFAGPDISEIVSGLRIKSAEVNGNLYFTTSTGIKKLSARTSADFPTISVQEAGAPKALDMIARPNFITPGFLSPNSKVAYRVVWGKRDLNENLLLGEPSSRVVVFNNSLTDSCVVDLEFGVPADVTDTNNFYQVYRTAVFSGDIPPDPVTDPVDPGDEMYLVFEDVVTTLQITNGMVEVQDITPEDFRKNGAFLYTNPESGDGIEQANAKPPFATDIALYKNYTFYANTKTVQSFNLAFLSIQNLVDNVSNFVISDGVTTNTYLFQGSIETYTIDFTGMIHGDFINGAPGEAKYFTFNSANDESKYFVYYYETTNDETPSLPGRIPIKVELLPADTLTQIIDKTVTAISDACTDFNFSGSGTVVTMACANNGYVTDVPTDNIGSTFTIVKDGLGTGQDAANKKIFLPRISTTGDNGPTPAQQLEQVARSLVNVINSEDDIAYAYYSSGYSDVPGQILFQQQDITGPAFYFTSNQGDQFNPTLPTSGTTISSTNEIRPNRVYYSKLQQPEAVPIANYIDIGPKDREIKRIVALRDSLFVFKEDGIYRLSGETAPFTVAPFDFSAQVLAADTPVVLNNQIYCLTTQGVCVITDTGNSVISRPIENLLLGVTRSDFAYKTAAFGVSYETDRSYLLYIVTTVNDAVATQCFRYNTFTSAWTRWDVTATCGIVNFADDKLYVGAGDINFIEKERKSLTRIDHADREYELQVLLNGVNGSEIKLNSVSQVAIGDVLIQTQYLTISQYNRILKKLDIDIGVTDDDYFATLATSAGKDLRSAIISLANKMGTDPGIAYSNFFSDINSYTYSILSHTVVDGQSVIQTAVNHSILPTRYITVDSTDIIFEVLSVTPDTMTLNGVINGVPTTVQTDVNSFQDIQACFNIMIKTLNEVSGAFYTNYPYSEDTTQFEIPVLEFNKKDNSVVIKTPTALVFGDITLYKAIKTKVIWNPVYFGDPSLTKQVREGTMIFENSNFSKVDIGFGTDLSPSFVSIEFSGDGLGVGDWGYFNFGTINWGGLAAPIPLRTLIPQGKQRCRFMNVLFEHGVAFEKFAIYGLSLTFRVISTRGYR